MRERSLARARENGQRELGSGVCPGRLCYYRCWIQAARRASRWSTSRCPPRARKGSAGRPRAAAIVAGSCRPLLPKRGDKGSRGIRTPTIYWVHSRTFKHSLRCACLCIRPSHLVGLCHPQSTFHSLVVLLLLVRSPGGSPRVVLVGVKQRDTPSCFPRSVLLESKEPPAVPPAHMLANESGARGDRPEHVE